MGHLELAWNRNQMPRTVKRVRQGCEACKSSPSDLRLPNVSVHESPREIIEIPALFHTP